MGVIGQRFPAASRLLGITVLWATLNALMKAYAAYATSNPWVLLQPSVEAILALVTVMLVSLLGSPGLRWIPAAASAALAGALVFEGLETAFDWGLGRGFSLAADLPLTDDLLSFALDAYPPAFVVMGIAVVLGILAGIYFGFRALLGRAATYFLETSHCVAFGAAVLTLFAAATARHLATDEPFWRFFHRHALMDRISAQVTDLFYDVNARATLRGARRRVAAYPAVPFSLLGNRNVYLFVVESYGETVFKNPSQAPLMKDSFAVFEKSLKKNGFSIRSAFLESPIHTSGSWMAEATLSCGVRVANHSTYQALLNSEIPCLGRLLGEVGYATVDVRPGTRYAWPKDLPGGKFFAFGTSAYEWHFPYRGPRFDWSPMPDQYVLNHAQKTWVKPLLESGKPVFAEYVLVTSHTPWALMPPYLADWSEIDSEGSIYSEHSMEKFPRFSEAGYLHSIRYELKVLEDFIQKEVDPRALVIIVGDHQPVRTVSGARSGFGVPVHILSKDAKALKAYGEFPWTRGLKPRLDQRSIPMDELLGILIRAYSRDPRDRRA